MTLSSASATDKKTGQSVRHSRNGCIVCKDRRRRCTEERPSCARCTADNRACKYILRLTWEDESRERGIKHGRGGQFEKQVVNPVPSTDLINQRGWNVPQHETRQFLNTYTTAIVGNSLRQVVHFGPLRVKARSVGPPYGIGDNCLGFTDGLLFQYYESQICYNLTLVNDSSNGFRYIVLPAAHSYKSVRHSVLAAGALHLSLDRPSNSLDNYVVALRHKQKALGYLRNEIASLNGKPSSHILISMVMLCLFDITDNCQVSWSMHLKAASDMLQIMDTASKDPLIASFVSKFFATRDAMSRSACGAASKFRHMSAVDSQEIDKSWGCSFELMNIISSITDLSRRKSDFKTSEQKDHSSKILELESRLESIIQTMPPLGSLVARNEAQLLSQTAALIQNATNIYFCTALHSAGPRTHLIQSLIGSQIDLIGNLQSLRSTHLWSIFVTSLYAHVDEDRLFFIDQFDRLENTRPAIGPAVTARAIVEIVWKRRDLDADSNDKNASLSDWERYVRPLSEGLSLA
ncbi:putative transcriptional regulatory protein [Lachnellula suecica]|uniref:Putative transcriptional regulatory protein n=1 Tax=Lachnellula suecica TaxID=602035 RepID=A0A8T9BXG2_9HELO|nr:putative transcriptional regulatory protein [Lachnellula suecica]